MNQYGISNKIIKIGLGKERYPSALHVRIYLSEKGFTEEESQKFLHTMLVRGWRTQTGRPIKNWKQYLFEWQYILKNPIKKSKRTDK